VEDKSTGVQYAAKAFSKKELSTKKLGRKDLMNEIMIHRQTNHNNIAKLEAVYETDRSVYLVMELLEGELLFQNHSKKKLPKNLVLTILKNLLKAVEHLNSLGIIHRDLKHTNIIFKNDEIFKNPKMTEKSEKMKNCLKVIDFGLAFSSKSGEKPLHRRCGTPGFMAPEVINIGKEGTVEECLNCDMYSLGIIFFRLLTGIFLFDGENAKEIYAKNRALKIDWKMNSLENVEPSALDLLKRMLCEDPKQRVRPQEALRHEFFQDGDKGKNVIQKKSLKGKKILVKKIKKIKGKKIQGEKKFEGNAEDNNIIGCIDHEQADCDFTFMAPQQPLDTQEQPKLQKDKTASILVKENNSSKILTKIPDRHLVDRSSEVSIFAKEGLNAYQMENPNFSPEMENNSKCKFRLKRVDTFSFFEGHKKKNRATSKKLSVGVKPRKNLLRISRNFRIVK
jgi:serine/threonine protein kinase